MNQGWLEVLRGVDCEGPLVEGMKLVTQRVRDADEALNNGTRGVSWTPKEAADDKQPSRYALKCKMGQSNV